MNYLINKERYCIRFIDGEAILLCFENGLSHKLDDVATIIFKLIEEHVSRKKILVEFFKVFPDEDENVLLIDFDEFIDTLICKEIITVQTSK